jgi:hypothetical protein
MSPVHGYRVYREKAYPWHRIYDNLILHFGPLAWVMLVGGTTKDFHFAGMPPVNVLLVRRI